MTSGLESFLSMRPWLFLLTVEEYWKSVNFHLTCSAVFSELAEQASTFISLLLMIPLGEEEIGISYHLIPRIKPTKLMPIEDSVAL